MNALIGINSLFLSTPVADPSESLTEGEGPARKKQKIEPEKQSGFAKTKLPLSIWRTITPYLQSVTMVPQSRDDILKLNRDLRAISLVSKEFRAEMLPFFQATMKARTLTVFFAFQNKPEVTFQELSFLQSVKTINFCDSDEEELPYFSSRLSGVVAVASPESGISTETAQKLKNIPHLSCIQFQPWDFSNESLLNIMTHAVGSAKKDPVDYSVAGLSDLPNVTRFIQMGSPEKDDESLFAPDHELYKKLQESDRLGSQFHLNTSDLDHEWLNPKEIKKLGSSGKHLTYLCLGSKHFNDDTLKSLGQLSNLRTLIIKFGEGFSIEGIKHLQPLGELTHLEICVPVTADCLPIIAKQFPKLTSLRLPFLINITVEQLQSIATLIDLRELVIGTIEAITVDSFASGLTEATNLERLYINAPWKEAVEEIEDTPDVFNVLMSLQKLTVFKTFSPLPAHISRESILLFKAQVEGRSVIVGGKEQPEDMSQLQAQKGADEGCIIM